MRKHYLHLALVFVLSLFVGQSFAQTAGNIYLGHCKYDDYIYEYDGLSLDHDSKVGVGIKLTRDMFEDYIGGKISAFRCGWDDAASSATYDCFVKVGNFNGETIATGRGTVKFGWNEVRVTQNITIPDVDTLCVGFYVNVKKNVCSIPKFYPTNVANSCFLFNNETTEDGKEIWYDSRSMGVMPIMLKISDTAGQFQDMLVCHGVKYDEIVPTSTQNIGVYDLENKGSNNITSLHITSKIGDQVRTDEIKMTAPITPGMRKNFKLPVYCFETGVHEITFDKVNGNAPKKVATTKAEVIGVPAEVSKQYTHRPLIEFFMSENAYHVPQYFDLYFMAGYEAFMDKMTLVCQHTDDKYMIGDPDEAIQLHLGMVNNDSMSVFLPDMMINRSLYGSNPVPGLNYPIHMGILYPSEIQVAYYNDILKHPTFASVNVKANLDAAGENVNITVNGNVADNVLPEGEHLYLTVYLMENEVESYDQRFWDDKEGEQVGNRYVHYNIIRENLTPLWGKKLSNASGDFTMNFTAEVYDDYNKENLSVIAFLNRGDQNPHLKRQVINSKEEFVGTDNTGIGSVVTDESNKPVVYYDLMGRRVLNPTQGGVYIKNGQKVLVK